MHWGRAKGVGGHSADPSRCTPKNKNTLLPSSTVYALCVSHLMHLLSSRYGWGLILGGVMLMDMLHIRVDVGPTRFRSGTLV